MIYAGAPVLILVLSRLVYSYFQFGKTFAELKKVLLLRSSYCNVLDCGVTKHCSLSHFCLYLHQLLIVLVSCGFLSENLFF